MCSFRDVDGREVPAMTSLRLGINGARSEQVTPAPPSYDLYETSTASVNDFVVMRRADGGWRDIMRHGATWPRPGRDLARVIVKVGHAFQP